MILGKQSVIRLLKDEKKGFVFLSILIEIYCATDGNIGMQYTGYELNNIRMTCTSQASSNSYTMGCPPVRGDNPRALASGLS